MTKEMDRIEELRQHYTDIKQVGMFPLHQLYPKFINDVCDFLAEFHGEAPVEEWKDCEFWEAMKALQEGGEVRRTLLGETLNIIITPHGALGFDPYPIGDRWGPESLFGPNTQWQVKQ